VSRANPQNPVCLKCTGFIYLGQPKSFQVDRVFQTCYNTHIDSKEHMMIKVTYKIVILDTLTQKVTDGFSPVFALQESAKDWLKNEQPLIAGCEYRILKTTVELV
jgi:hypothetical protein